MNENDQQRSPESPPDEPRSTQTPPGSDGSQLLDRCHYCGSKLPRLATSEIESYAICERCDIDPKDVLREIRHILEKNFVATVITAIEQYAREKAKEEGEHWEMLQHALMGACFVSEYIEGQSSISRDRRTIERLEKEIAILRSGEAKQ